MVTRSSPWAPATQDQPGPSKQATLGTEDYTSWSNFWNHCDLIMPINKTFHTQQKIIQYKEFAVF